MQWHILIIIFAISYLSDQKPTPNLKRVIIQHMLGNTFWESIWPIGMHFSTVCVLEYVQI